MKCFKCNQEKEDTIVFDYGCICQACYIEKFKTTWRRNPLLNKLTGLIQKFPNLPHSEYGLALKAWEEMKKKYKVSCTKAAAKQGRICKKAGSKLKGPEQTKSL